MYNLQGVRPLLPPVITSTSKSKRREYAAVMSYETDLIPKGSSIRSCASLLATSPPFSNETAPMTAYMVCARTSSSPDAMRLSGYYRLATEQYRNRTISAYLPGFPSDHCLHVVLARQLGHLCPVGQEALGASGEMAQAFQGRVGERNAAKLVCLWCAVRGSSALRESERSLQLHDAFS